MTAEEKVFLSRYIDIDAIKTYQNIQTIVKTVNSVSSEEIADIIKILFKYFKKDPVPIAIDRAQYALFSIGAGSFPPWLYTPASRKFFGDDKLAMAAETLGSIKTPGDPFYSESAEIYRDQHQMPPFTFSYGIIFILLGLFLFRSIPVSSLICWTIFTKLLAIALLAPLYSMHYVIDVYWFCALIPILAWAEYQERKSKAKEVPST